MPQPPLKVRAVIFDLDETLIEEETPTTPPCSPQARFLARHGVDPVALLTALRKRSRELFLAGPMIDYCRAIGVGAREALWGAFAGDDPALALLGQWVPWYRFIVDGSVERSRCR